MEKMCNEWFQEQIGKLNKVLINSGIYSKVLTGSKEYLDLILSVEKINKMDSVDVEDLSYLYELQEILFCLRRLHVVYSLNDGNDYYQAIENLALESILKWRLNKIYEDVIRVGNIPEGYVRLLENVLNYEEFSLEELNYKYTLG